MGFDISYHPMSRTQMEEWYFAPLKALINDQFSRIEELLEESKDMAVIG